MSNYTLSDATIAIQDLTIDALIGVFENERKAPQPLTFHVELRYNDQLAAENDDFNAALDYDLIEKKIRSRVLNTQYFLLERLAKDILASLMTIDKLTYCRLTINKPNALKRCGAMVSITKTATR